jgi:uncharacterized protein (TIGR03663 family)
MRLPLKYCILILIASIVALSFRLPKLQMRPMHGDEAVQAIKFMELLEKNAYRYDLKEYHGPTLNYFTLIPAWLRGCKKLVDVNEVTLRIVPVFFGVLLVLVITLITNGLGRTAAVYAAFLTAVSPAMVFYSRYYIHEMLLVCFTFGTIACGYRYIKGRNILWAISAGAFAGLMHATKETSIIAFYSIVFAALLIWLTRDKKTHVYFFKTIRPLHLLASIITAVIVSILFYSSFFTNPHGIIDSVLTYKNYLTRTSESSLHYHPWYYYFRNLIWPNYDGLPMVSEILIVLLAFYGFIISLAKRSLGRGDIYLLRFIGFFTIIMATCYSLIPYKTPWCMLSFLQGMIIMAGFAVAAIIRYFTQTYAKNLVYLLLAFGLLGLGLQTYVTSYTHYADPSNPYVYAHPTRNVFVLQKRVRQIASVHPDGKKIYIQVISPENYWPIPWYLRDFPNVGYLSEPDMNAPPAPVIIASEKVEQKILALIYEGPTPGQRNLYVPLFDSRYIELRPNVRLLGMVTKELWDSFQKSKQ